MELNRCTSIVYVLCACLNVPSKSQSNYVQSFLHDPGQFLPQDFWDDAEDTALLPFSDGPCCGGCLEGPEDGTQIWY